MSSSSPCTTSAASSPAPGHCKEPSSIPGARQSDCGVQTVRRRDRGGEIREERRGERGESSEKRERERREERGDADQPRQATVHPGIVQPSEPALPPPPLDERFQSSQNIAALSGLGSARRHGAQQGWRAGRRQKAGSGRQKSRSRRGLGAQADGGAEGSTSEAMGAGPLTWCSA